MTSFAALTAVHALVTDSTLLGWLRLGLVVAFTIAILLAPAWNATPLEPASAGSGQVGRSGATGPRGAR